MKTISPEISDAGRAVGNYKPEPFRRLKAEIIRRAMAQLYVYPGDIPEELCAPDDRQGVASNVWSELWSLEIIERLPLSFSNDEAGIVGGRKRNRNPHAKGRWTAVYRLASRARAVLWLQRNGEDGGWRMEDGKREQLELIGA